MRSDMAKVIVERERTGGFGGKSYEPKGYAKRIKKEMIEGNEVAFESNSPHRKHGWNAKEFSERLGPLRNYLDTKVGEAWNEVYSEICENLSLDNVIQSHVRDHVKMDVELNTYEDTEGIIRDTQGHEIWKRYYVDSEGIFQKNEQRRGRHHKKQNENFIWIVPLLEAFALDVKSNIWYHLYFKKIPATRKRKRSFQSVRYNNGTLEGKTLFFLKDEEVYNGCVWRDMWLRKSYMGIRGAIWDQDSQRVYGTRDVYCYLKKQCGSKELSQLWNSKSNSISENTKGKRHR